MSSLKIPDNGVMLKGSASADAGSLPHQAFAISLSDNVIENMIKCVQTGGDISLALGENPSFHFGSDSHTISRPESQLHDLYLTKPFESTREAYRLPLTMSIFSKPNKLLQAGKAAVKTRIERVTKEKQQEKQEPTPKQKKSTTSSTTSSSSNVESDVEVLRKELLAQEMAKGRSVLVNTLPTGKKGSKAKGSFLTGSSNTPRSVPQSPSLKPNASPLSIMSSTDQAKERSKQLRKTLVHELAVSDQTTSYLEGKFDGPAADFRPTLDKVAVISGGSVWKLRQSYWRDLDPYAYRYKDDKTRNTAIENAIKIFDKQRISPSEPEWQRLLPVEERGKGKSLSRLQEKLAKGPPNPPPKITLQKPDDSSTSKDDDPLIEKTQKMSRSTNPLKQKKASTQAAAKRAASNPSKPKPSSIKASPTKPKTAAKTNGRPALSQEFIENSDSSGDEAVVVERPRPAEPKPLPKPAAKPAPKLDEKPLPRPKPKTAAKEPVQRTALKRPPTDDDSSSSSGTPLSKRLKIKQPLPSQKTKSTPIEVRKAHRDVSAPSSGRNKNTSPVKSSPLASSPPTNASELSEDERRLPSKKRKANGEVIVAPAAKRHAPSAEVMSQAAKFEAAYQQYYTLHFEIADLKNPPMDKLDSLNDLRSRLQVMKAEIYKKHGSSRH
uniref:Uncharacterized protein n=1 Tax=Bionectria ochroleuca TaxID=29856 RepID=A0A8H7N7I0_BIOOC